MLYCGFAGVASRWRRGVGGASAPGCPWETRHRRAVLPGRSWPTRHRRVVLPAGIVADTAPARAERSWATRFRRAA